MKIFTKTLRFLLGFTVLFFTSTVNNSVFSQVTLPFTDAIEYSAVGNSLSSQPTWTSMNTGDSIMISSGSLSYSGLAASVGDKIAFDGAGIDAAKAFTQQTSGTVYSSFLMNVTALGSLETLNGGYFFGFTEGTTTTFGGALWTRPSGAGFSLGLSPRTSLNSQQWSSELPLNTTVLVVIAYQMVAGTSNDVVSVWINPVPGEIQPLPTLTVTNTVATDLSNINRIFIRQDSSTETPFIEMDEFRVGLTFEDVTPTGGVLAPQANILSFTLPEQTSSAVINSSTKTIEIHVANGTNLASLTPTITVSDGAMISPSSGVAQNFLSVVTYTVTSSDYLTTNYWDVTVIEDSAIPVVSIYDIQYSTSIPANSPYSGQTITTTGTVTAVVAGQGYYIQESESAWSGVYVYSAANAPSVGDNITITATVSEYNQLTELTGVTNFVTNSTGNTINPISLTTLATNDEQHESVLVSVSNAQCLTLADGFGVWSVDDGSGATKVDDIMYVASPIIGNTYSIVGVLYDRLAEYRILPRNASDVVEGVLSSDAEITAFGFTEQYGVEDINSVNGTVYIEVLTGTNLTSLTPTISISSGATISPVSGLAQDFSIPVAYIVTAQDGTQKTWTITVAYQSTSIYEIQYSLTGSSPLVGQTVNLSNVTVTAVGVSGYYIQDAAGAWNGVYVYESLNKPAVGDNISFTALVAEYNGLTELTTISNFTILSSGNPTYATTVLTSEANTEQYEGVLVKVMYATCTQTNVSGTWAVNDGSGVLKIFKTLYDFTTATLDVNYDVTGVVTWYNVGAIYELLPRSAADVVVSAVSSEKDILTFEFAEQVSAATIDANAGTISIQVYQGTSLTALIPTITTSPQSSINPLSGVARDFTNTVLYTVTAQDASTKNWFVTVTVSSTLSNLAEISDATLNSSNQHGSVSINSLNSTVEFIVSPNADLTAYSPTFTLSSGASISPLSGSTQNFTNPVNYTVTAQDGTQKIWSVKVTPQTITTIFDIQNSTGDSPLKSQVVTTTGTVVGIKDYNSTSGLLMGFFIQSGTGAFTGIYVESTELFAVGDSIFVTGTVDEKYNFTYIKGASSKLIQIDRPTYVNEITAAEVNTESYEGCFIKVNSVECSSGVDMYGVWKANQGVDVVSFDDVLVPTGSFSSMGIAVGKIYNVSGFIYYSYAVFYVIPRDISEVVEILPMSAENDILSFEFAEQSSAAVINTVNHTVTIDVYSGTNVTSLVPTILVSPAASINPASGVARDFSSSVVYSVTAENGTSQFWIVTVNVSTTLSPEADILTFDLPNENYVITKTIDASGSTVNIIVLPSMSLTSVSPTITTSSGASVSPASGVVQNLTYPVVYTVTAADGVTKKYWVISVSKNVNKSIYDIQYTTNISGDSPVKDQNVSTKGVITAIIPNEGYFIQDAEAVWSGILVNDYDPALKIGDEVEVYGTVIEYNSLTQISPVYNTIVLSSNNSMSPIVATDIITIKSEQYESVLVSMSSNQCTEIGTGYWMANDGTADLTVDEVIYSTPVELNNHYDITGVVYESSAQFGILPRIEGDIIHTLNVLDFETEKINVYPNPVENYLNIENIEKCDNIIISNILGQQNIFIIDNLSNIKIDLSNFDSGIYFVTIYKNNEIIKTQKITKK